MKTDCLGTQCVACAKGCGASVHTALPLARSNPPTDAARPADRLEAYRHIHNVIHSFIVGGR